MPRYSKGKFNWDVWMLLDEVAMRKLSPQVEKLLPFAAGSTNGAQVKIHLLENGPLTKRYGENFDWDPIENVGKYRKQIRFRGCMSILSDNFEIGKANNFVGILIFTAV